MDNLLKEFQSFIKARQLFSSNDRLLLAVSGGLDSTVMTDLCYHAGFDFLIAHVNFQLRAAESEKDQAFVEAMGKCYQKEVLVKKFETNDYAKRNSLSVQTAARKLRYDWFRDLLNTHPSKPVYILTAHHLDDNIETMLMYFFRGTGIAGLRGIVPKQERVVRPLLFAFKEQLEKYAVARGLYWREDRSNAEDKYTRNALRNKIIPAAKEIFPDLLSNLSGNLERFAETEELFRQAIEWHKKKLMVAIGNEVQIPVLKLKKTTPLATVVYEIIRAYGFSSAQVPELISLMDSISGKYILSSTHRIIKDRRWLIIAPLQEVSPRVILIEKDDRRIAFQKSEILFEKISAGHDLSDHTLKQPPHIAMLDAKQIDYPILLRKWKPGDYFYPFGMPKKKKLARFFIDQKLSRTAKENIWILESNKKIIWVAGFRIDDRFKISSKTRDILKIELRMC